jgi:predicted permease
MFRRLLFFRRHRQQELDEEIQAHLAMARNDRIERGEEPQAAEQAVHREFGNRALVLETTREMWGWQPLERLWQDMRYALRGMRRSPGFTAVAVLSMALGIGANTAIFSLVDLLMLRLLPVQEPGQLVEFLNQYPGDPPGNSFSWRSYEYFRDHNHVFSGLTGDQPSRFRVRGGGLEPEIVQGNRVVGNFFQMLGIKPAIGRLIGPEDAAGLENASPGVAVLNWSYWNSRFHRDPEVLGRRIVVDDVSLTIIGVAPRAFAGLQLGAHPDLWIPLAPGRGGSPGAHSDASLRLVGRLKPGISIEQARAEMAVLFRWTIEERVSETSDVSRRSLERRLKFAVEPAGAGLSTVLHERFARPLLAAMAVVGLLLLIACTNVAGMLLARGASRQRELAVRLSLGAGRVRIAAQMLTESLLLAGAGGLLSAFLAHSGADVLVRIITSGRFVGGPLRIEISWIPDVHILLFTGGAILVTGVLFGLAPAWNAFSSSRTSWLRQMGGAGGTRFQRGFGRSLVIAQMALSVTLLSGAGLFIHHLWNLKQIDLGFRRDHVLLVTLDPERTGFSSEQLSRAYQDVLARLEQIPGVHSASLVVGRGPLSGDGASQFVNVEGHPERLEDRRYISLSWVAPMYFRTMGTALLAGRDFRDEDRSGPPVAIVNEAMARYYFLGENPLGKYLRIDRDRRSYEIIGVVGNAKYYEMREAARRTIYLSAFRVARSATTFMLRTGIDPQTLAPAARQIVRDALKDVPVVRVGTLDDQVDATIVPERLIAGLSGSFGALGALLAAVGIYGSLAYMVTRRINEIGIRMALGATRGGISRMVLGEALWMTCAGVTIGVLAAYWGRRLAGSLIPDLPLTSVVPIGFGLVVMIAIALFAAYVPARRAARVDPTEALRYE